VLGSATLHAFDLFGDAWLLFRDASGRAACIADSCAHRACPLSLGKNINGRVQCPYHGWEYDNGGACAVMPSCAFLPGVAVPSLPTVEQDGLLWVWPGAATPDAALPRFAPPAGFTTVAAVTLDVPIAWGRVLEGLLDAAERPSGAASAPAAAAAAAAASVDGGGGGDGLVAAAARALRAGPGGGAGGGASASGPAGAAWGAAPSALSFEPPSAVLSTLVLGAAASADVASASAPADKDDGDDDDDPDAPRRVHLLFACVPCTGGATRVLYRMAVNFTSPALATAPGARLLWQALAEVRCAFEGRCAARDDALRCAQRSAYQRRARARMRSRVR
jgi:chlorophyllide a oxygenase